MLFSFRILARPLWWSERVVRAFLPLLAGGFANFAVAWLLRHRLAMFAG